MMTIINTFFKKTAISQPQAFKVEAGSFISVKWICSALLFTSPPSSPLSPVHTSVPRSSCDAAAGADGVLAGGPVLSGVGGPVLLSISLSLLCHAGNWDSGLLLLTGRGARSRSGRKADTREESLSVWKQHRDPAQPHNPRNQWQEIK